MSRKENIVRFAVKAFFTFAGVFFLFFGYKAPEVYAKPQVEGYEVKEITLEEAKEVKRNDSIWDDSGSIEEKISGLQDDERLVVEGNNMEVKSLYYSKEFGDFCMVCEPVSALQTEQYR